MRVSIRSARELLLCINLRLSLLASRFGDPRALSPANFSEKRSTHVKTGISANRRELMGSMLVAGLTASASAAFAGEPGKLSEADYQKLAAAPKTAADHRTLAKHYRAVAAEHEN